MIQFGVLLIDSHFPPVTKFTGRRVKMLSADAAGENV
jgi:hypothetical protein